MAHLRPANRGDEAPIAEIHRAAFAGQAEATLVAALTTSGDAQISLVAEMHGQLAGHILLSSLLAPPQCLTLAPLAVLPSHQNRGIGGALIKEGLRRAQALGWKGVFVLGEPAYYGRFDFSLDLAAPFDSPYPKDFMMAIELMPGGLKPDDLPSGSARIVYPAPFDGLDPGTLN
ncbi:MAG: N-acetyltransferase [Pseudomonadota bacterium]